MDDNWWLAEPLNRKGEGHKFKIGDFINWKGGCGRIVNYSEDWLLPKGTNEAEKHFYIINWKVLPKIDRGLMPGIWRESRLEGATFNYALEALYGTRR